MHFYLSGTVDFLLFHHPLSFSLTCLHAYLLLLFSHSPPLPLESVKTLWRWKWGRHRVRERVPHLPLNSKNSLSRSIDGSGCTASEGAIKAGKLRELIRLLLDRMERGEKRQESPQSTPIYTSVTTNVSPDFIWTYGNTIHWINPTMIDVWWRPSSVFLFFFQTLKDNQGLRLEFQEFQVWNPVYLCDPLCVRMWMSMCVKSADGMRR